MKQIDIYIHTLTHSRGKGPAVYKSVLEFVKSDGEVCTLEVTGADKETTTNRITTEAVVMALRRIKLNQPYKIRIHADSDYFTRMLKATRVYAEHEWKTKTGKEIANVDLWKEIYIFKKTNHVTADNNLLDHYECKEELEESLCTFMN